MWLSHDGFPGVVREAWEGNSQDVCLAVETFTQKAKTWNKEVFGDIFWKKRNLTVRLLGAEKALANYPSQRLIDIHKFLSGEMEKILVLEEELWGMKARINWLIQGERNITFFHITALNRRSRNRIVGINDSDGNWIVDIDKVKEIFLMGFKKLYSSEQCIKKSAEFYAIVPNSSNKPPQTQIQVKWMKPNPGWVKLNTDGAVGGALGKAGGGGVLRCNRGNWVAGFIRKLGADPDKLDA
nr:putative ribonuclease h protein [Quercus suber]